MMRRRYGKTKLEVRQDSMDDINPMEGVANLVDAMLVLACGLMLALIINWNVDVGSAGTTVELEQNQEVTSLEGVSSSGETSTMDGSYEEMGMVYRDPATGKLYMVTPEHQEAGSGNEG